MSNDVLAPFDSDIEFIEFDEDCVTVGLGDGYSVLFDEKDLECMLMFLRNNKEKK